MDKEETKQKVEEIEASESDPMVVEGATSVEQETEGAEVPLTTDPDTVEGVVPESDIELED